MPGHFQLAGKVAHGGQHRQQFLRVVQRVTGFLSQLQQQVHHIAAWQGKPAVQRG
ncbi:hypothetical protein QU481_18380 [Crenobacter sp. SG2303]|uniref:Uncharacterized protein n=1 Tax=Crenobacter oryzisoli TaxID=3056844 RepID=A0ABT7XSN5_9NEIS|nr:hypothetical protein [Crenobacter sp. SG2303]MDN0076818.1 hypothetical protein [Crenobacter sp. SG2303]